MQAVQCQNITEIEPKTTTEKRKQQVPQYVEEDYNSIMLANFKLLLNREVYVSKLLYLARVLANTVTLLIF